MEEDININRDLFTDNNLGALPKKPRELVAKPSTLSEWPSLPVSKVPDETSVPASSIRPEQKPPARPATPVSYAIKKKSPGESQSGGHKVRGVGAPFPQESYVQDGSLFMFTLLFTES